jgi:hypothetical protein
MHEYAPGKKGTQSRQRGDLIEIVQTSATEINFFIIRRHVAHFRYQPWISCCRLSHPNQ